MYLLKIDDLKKGDVVLTSQDSITSKLVRRSTGGDFSHAILYVGSGSYIHSDLNGVHSNNIQRLLFESEDEVVVLRGEFSPEIINEICNFARRQVGKAYSVKDAVKTRVKVNRNANENRQFCSRLVAQSYASAGISLVEDPNYCTPHELSMSNLLLKVEEIVEVASSDKIAFAQSDNPLERQANITNLVLKKIREISGKDIQTIEQITILLIEDSSYDQKFSEVIKASGYLTMWQDEMRKNPWRYNGNMFLALPYSKDDLIKMADSELQHSSTRLDRFSSQLIRYKEILNSNNLEYFRAILELYSNLTQQALYNLKAAEYVKEELLGRK